MLLLTRRLGERLMIGDNVSVTVVGMTNGQVRLGIDAPLNIPVHREEIYKKNKERLMNGMGRGDNRLEIHGY